VTDYLEDAKREGLLLGVASSSTCNWVTGHLSRLGLYDYFDYIRAKDDVRVTKPDPELYLAVLEAMNIQADQAVVFEDSPNGIRAAKQAGIFCVAVPNGLTRQLSLAEADLCLPSLADLSLEELLPKVQMIRAHGSPDGKTGRL
jgi:beta-phosphoglucomutase-like phosphatase (HAD superfamily)